MKKLFIGIMCVMLITGCTTTNDKKADKSNIDQVQEVKKDNEQKIDQEQDKTVDKKEETEDKTKTETVKKEEKKETQKKTTTKKTTTKKKTDSTSKKTSTKKKTNTTQKKTTKKKTTPKKLPTIDEAKPRAYGCIDCGYNCKTEKEIKKHLKESGHGQYSIEYESFEWPEEWD